MQGDLDVRLLRAGLITRDQVHEALASNPHNEGALVVALIAGGVPEDAISDFFVYEGYGPLVGTEDLASADPSAVGKIPPSMADSWMVLPLRGDSSGWVVAMAAPSDLHAAQELARMLGGPIIPAVARVSALRTAIRATFLEEELAFPRESDPPVLELVHRRTREWEARPDQHRAANVEAARLWVEWEDDDEGEDPPLLLVRTKVRDDTNIKKSHPTRVVSKSFGRPLETQTSTPSQEAFPEHRGTADYEALPPDSQKAERWDEPANTASPEARSFAPSHLDFESHLTAIHLASNRDDVVRLTCEAGASLARSTVFLVLRRGALEGFDGAGGALSRESVRELVIPTGTPSKFRQVVESRQSYHGPYGTTIVDGIFRAAVESPGGNLLLHPVLVMDKVVGVLCADDPADIESDMPRFELLSKAVGEAFRRLLAQRGA